VKDGTSVRLGWPQAIKLKFRKGIVVDLLDEWLPRAYRLTQAGAIGANPDQRIE
jgi:ABC-type uncharacterized transport system fused permease/ATPase subunit